MCFSAATSFTTATVLLPVGGYCLHSARCRLPSYWAFAAVPVGFGLQQFAEGLVWLGLTQGDPWLTQIATASYLFFALGLWPLWFPLAAAIAEPQRVRRTLFIIWTVVGTGWLWFAYLPVLSDLSHLSVEIARHSVRYSYSDAEVFPGPARWLATAAYLFCTAGPLLAMSRWRQMLFPIGLGLVSVLVSGWFYGYAYTSVWCFFAATLSCYCAYFFAIASPETASTAGQQFPKVNSSKNSTA